MRPNWQAGVSACDAAQQADNAPAARLAKATLSFEGEVARSLLRQDATVKQPIDALVAARSWQPSWL
jgi:hypothetical protein